MGGACCSCADEIRLAHKFVHSLLHYASEKTFEKPYESSERRAMWITKGTKVCELNSVVHPTSPKECTNMSSTKVEMASIRSPTIQATRSKEMCCESGILRCWVSNLNLSTHNAIPALQMRTLSIMQLLYFEICRAQL